MEDREFDKKYIIAPMKETGLAKRRAASLDVIKSAYIAEGLSVEDISKRYALGLDKVKDLVAKHNLPELRKAYVREGITKIQNKQVNQAQKLMDVESDFKRLRIIQLEQKLSEFMAYYGRHGDFAKRHPVTGDILFDQNGMAIQIPIPNVANEIRQLKESVTLSEGLKSLLVQIDDIINKSGEEEVVVEDVVDADYSVIFEPSGS